MPHRPRPSSTTSGWVSRSSWSPVQHREPGGRELAAGPRAAPRRARRPCARRAATSGRARAGDARRSARAAPGGAARAPRTRRRPQASRRRGAAVDGAASQPFAGPSSAVGAAGERRAPSPRSRRVDAALVDREEEVLLRREVRVDGALGVAGGVGDRVDASGVEAVRREQAVGRLDQLLARPGLTVGACHGRTHTESIRILAVFVKYGIRPPQSTILFPHGRYPGFVTAAGPARGIGSPA